MPQYDTENFMTAMKTTKSFSISEVWVIISVLLAVIIGILFYNNYLGKDKENKYTGFKKFIYDFLNFKITIIEPIFRVLYIVCAIALTLGSFSLIANNFFCFIGILVFGNIALRLIYEFILLILNMIKNISEIHETLTNGRKNKEYHKEDKSNSKKDITLEKKREKNTEDN